MAQVHVAVQDGIALITLDNPPVNATGLALRTDLAAALDRVATDPGIRAAVLTGAGNLFVGGADITEFDQPPQPPHLPDLLTRIEASAKPIFAALHGAAHGGGLELALACHARTAAPGTQLSLPEVTLGIIPGAGGTQRLPRLIGWDAAVPLITEGKPVTAETALTLGLIDQIADDPVAAARALAAAPRRQRPKPQPVAPDFWSTAETRLTRSAKGAQAPLEALRVLRHGYDHGLTAGLADERATFLRLRESREAAALRHLFFAERAAPRPRALRDIPPRPLSTIGVVGGGTMGVGIAAALRNAGLNVILSERDQPALDRAADRLQAIFQADEAKGRLPKGGTQTRMAGVTLSLGTAPLAPCDMVIEAVFEDLFVKRAVFDDLSRDCRPDAILVTNTSYLDPRLIAANLPDTSRFLALHFFSPAQVMRLVEVIPTPQTSPQTLATAFDLARRLKKIPVRSGICDGFIGNRILQASRARAEALMLSGVPIATIDGAMRAFGYAMGPFEAQDLAGLDISFLRREAARQAGAPVADAPGDLLVRAGRLGQKSGGGWYDYAPGDRAPRPSPETARILAPLLAPERDEPPEAIAQDLITAMATEGQAILAEGIAQQPSDIDLVLVHGYGFPRHKGGPMFLSA